MNTGKRRVFKEGQKSFSSGDVAYLIGVTTHTASRMMVEDKKSVEMGRNWRDRGRIPCFRLPLAGYRRVTRANLVAYLKQAGLYDSLKEIGEDHDGDQSE
jgi:hypothetical protein